MCTYHSIEAKKLSNTLSNILHIATKLQESKGLGKGQITNHVPGEILDPGTQVTNIICFNKQSLTCGAKAEHGRLWPRLEIKNIC